MIVREGPNDYLRRVRIKEQSPKEPQRSQEAGAVRTEGSLPRRSTRQSGQGLGKMSTLRERDEIR